MTGALLRYRIMADTVGVGLLLLVLVGMPLKYIAGKPAVVAVIGPIHGFLYILYLLSAVDLSRRVHFTVRQMVAVAGAGLVPFLAFVVERRTTQRIERQLSSGVRH